MEKLLDDSSQFYTNQELRDSVYRLLKYAVSDANFDVDDKIIQDVVPVLQKDVEKFTTEDETILWLGYNALSIQVYPATNESLWLKEHMERDDRAQAEGNTAGFSSTARAYKKTYASFKWLGYVFGIVFFLLQSYNVILFDSLEQVDDYYAQLVKIDEQITAVKQGSPDIKRCDPPLKELRQKEDQLYLKIDSHYQVMWRLSRFFWGVFYTSNTLDYYQNRPEQCPNITVYPPYRNLDPFVEFNQNKDQQAKAERATFFEGARSNLRLCNYLILPLILGTLGSVAYVIRNILDSFAKASLTFGSNRRGGMRIYLGALLGLISGVIVSPNIPEIQDINYSPLLWAFLMGYSVEFAFTFFDSLIARGRIALQAIKEPGSSSKSVVSEEKKPKPPATLQE